MGEAATSEAKALCAVCAVAASRDANCQRLQRRHSTALDVDRTVVQHSRMRRRSGAGDRGRRHTHSDLLRLGSGLEGSFG